MFIVSMDDTTNVRLKYLNNYEMDCHGILYRRSWSREN